MTWREGLVSMRPVRRWVWGGVYLAAGEATDGDDHICSRGGVIEAQLVVSRKLSSLSQRCRWEVEDKTVRTNGGSNPGPKMEHGPRTFSQSTKLNRICASTWISLVLPVVVYTITSVAEQRIPTMAKETERKRKLEQEHVHTATPKRQKQAQKSAAKANGTVNGSTPKHNAVPATTDTPDTPKLSKQEKKAARVSEVKTELQQPVNPDESQATPAKNAKKRKSLQNGASTHVKQVTGSNEPEKGADVPMVDADAGQAESKKNKKKKKQRVAQELVECEQVDTAAGAEQRSESGTILSTNDKRQRALEKKARRIAHREVKAGLKGDEELTKPNEYGWWLSQPSAGRYIAQDPIFVVDENGDECLIAATVREVQLLHLNSSLLARTHAVPDGRSILAYTLSAEYPDHVEVSYDNGAKVQWNWTNGSISNGNYPGQETTIAMTSASLADGRSEVYYISRSQGTYTIVGKRKALYSTYRRLQSIQVLGDGVYIICLGATAMVLGKKKDNSNTPEYIWIEMPTPMPFQCLDARLVLPASAKNTTEQKVGTSDLALAIGNVEGQIHFYSSLNSLFGKASQATLPDPRILHWHREAVSTVKFSRDGNYLISGGRESVLVIWQLETGQKQFLPHLTAEVERLVVSPNGTQYALQLGDNSVMVLSTAELKPIANFAGLQLPVRSEQLWLEEMTVPATTAVLHPTNPSQLLLTVPATQPKYARDVTTRPFLQTFDLQNARHISRQALSRNNVTDFNRGPENTPIIPPDVNLLALSADGKWLATVDEWFPPATDLEHAVARTAGLDNIDLTNIHEQQLKRREVYLKFWKWDEQQQIWTLSTRADAPHARTSNSDLGNGAGRVLELKSDPASNGFATVGEDGEVKIWKSKPKFRNGVPLQDARGDDLMEWTCRRTVGLPIATDLEERADSPMDGVFEHNKTQSAIDACLAYSPDGSMLACTTISADETTQPLVHFINPNTGAVTATKTGIIPADEDVQSFGFLDRYFIVLSLGHIRVWNLVDDNVHYTIKLRGSVDEQENAKLAINSTDDTFAVASTLPMSIENDVIVPQIIVYTPKLPEPLFEAELESSPVALLAGQDTKGYTILFEDGTIRTLSSTAQVSSRDRRLSIAASPSDKMEEESQNMAENAETASSSALAKLSTKAEDQAMAESLAPLMLTEGEDDRPVIRPEHLTSIFDVGGSGGSVALPPVRDMFRDLVGLLAKKPRARVAMDV